jgi:RNA-directed DNA polymerase
VNWILEADITSFFDSLDRTKLKELLQIRVADGSLLRLIGKLLRVGVLDGAEYSAPDLGTAQGSALSPLLGNVVLHYVLNAWFEQVVLPSLGGRATLVRYADDFVIGFERREDAQRVMALLHERMASFGLTLHPDKTRLLPFQGPPAGQRSGKGPATFDFLGFTLYWGRARSGRWCMWCKTRSSRLQGAIKVAADWCPCHRHDSALVQHAALSRRIQGHFNDFGVSGNYRNLVPLVEATKRNWLRRPCNKSRLTWERFATLLERYPLPTPRIRVRIWGS